mmetsp:Transcript_30504/g.116762  ORF Transcript_30504/g.116762 Transcript_30504/m.116762 type:complete len:94 (+) Transcript_30504:403-684(+)
MNWSVAIPFGSRGNQKEMGVVTGERHYVFMFSSDFLEHRARLVSDSFKKGKCWHMHCDASSGSSQSRNDQELSGNSTQQFLVSLDTACPFLPG